MISATSIKSIGALAVLASLSAVSTVANAQALNRTYTVTVTNITKSNLFTPSLGVTHASSVALFELGEEASAELADLAESGAVGPLAAVLAEVPNVAATASTEGLLAAGDSVTFDVEAYAWIRRFSMAAMVLPTNDTFVGLDSVDLPRSPNQSITYHAIAYDAGSEFNDELDGSIPGPITGGQGLSAPSTNPLEPDEGFVHIANGIHGIGTLQPSVYSWDGPVAKVEITRTR